MSRKMSHIIGCLVVNFILIFDFYGYSQSIKIKKVKVFGDSNYSKTFDITPTGSFITLKNNQNNILIYFEAPKSSTYSYRLNSYRSFEIETRDDKVFYSNLPSGEYEFEVRDTVNAQIKPAKLKIIVEMPIWQKWWFLPMMFVYSLILISVIFYFLLQYRLRQELKLQNVRNNIARDLHDDMGSYLSSISILSQNIENLTLKDPELAKKSLQKIGETARQVMDSMGDIVWSVNPLNDSMDQIISRMQDTASELFFSQETNIRFDIQPSVRNISMSLELRRDFFLIFKEGLTNAFKYAQAENIEVKLKRENQQLYLVIQDDGVGFDFKENKLSKKQGGNGLKNMQARADKIGGELVIESFKKKGTMVLLKISV